MQKIITLKGANRPLFLQFINISILSFIVYRLSLSDTDLEISIIKKFYTAYYIRKGYYFVHSDYL